MKLIDADKLLEKMSGHCDVCQYHCHRKHTSCGECDWHEAMSDVDDMDNVEPVRHGHWTKISPAGIYECSNCKNDVMTADIDVYKYCHRCGAKINEVSE